MFLIYCITNKNNGKRYIGLTSRTIHDRWLEHKSSSKREDTLLYRAIRKHGLESFDIRQIDKTDDEDTAAYLEMLWIAAFKSFGNLGYNSDEGGLGYYNPTPETLKKRSESIKQGYENGRHSWCYRADIEESEVARLYESGLSQRQIAKQLKTSKRTIAVRLKKLAVEQRSVGDYTYIVSDETRKKMSDAKLADPLTVERCRKMTRERLERRLNGTSG